MTALLAILALSSFRGQATTSNLAATQSALPYTLTLSFANGKFTSGNKLAFTIGRSIHHSSDVSIGTGPTGGTTITNSRTYSADLFGGGVLLPKGTVTNAGLTFSGTISDGSTFSGTIQNRTGFGYSKLDGYGFINAATAVSATPQ